MIIARRGENLWRSDVVVHGGSPEKEDAAVVCPSVAVHASTVVCVMRSVNDVVSIMLDEANIPHPIPRFDCLICVRLVARVQSQSCS